MYYSMPLKNIPTAAMVMVVVVSLSTAEQVDERLQSDEQDSDLKT